MRSFGSPITAFVIIGFFGITAWSAPFQRHHATGPLPSTSSPTSSSSESTTSSTASTGSGGTETVSAGSGTAGYATIVNKCSFTAWIDICIQNPATCSGSTSIAANGGVYSEPYASASEGGPSWKLSVNESLSDILQFEYTNEGNGKVSYDLSEVNGNPFGTWGFSLTNTTTDVYCAPPATDCPNIFTDPTNGIPYTASTSDGIGAILCG